MRIFVGCSSREEVAEKYFELAKNVFGILSSYELVLGGALVGLMGVIGSSVLNDSLTQVFLKDYLEEGMQPSKQLLVCDTTFSRLQNIWNLSDCFVFLPGSTGTLSEIFAFLEENRMKEKKKKLFVLNYEGFYDECFQFIEKAKELKFSDSYILESMIFVPTIEELEILLKKEEMNL